jgi:hypothetical protein
MWIPSVLCDHRPTTYIRLIDGALMADKRTGAWSFVDPAAYQTTDHNGVPQIESTGDDYHISVVEMLYTPEAFFETMNQLSKEPWFKADKFFEFFGRFWSMNERYAKARHPGEAAEAREIHGEPDKFVGWILQGPSGGLK